MMQADLEVAVKKIFGPDAYPYLQMVDSVLKRAKVHQYSFYSEEYFESLKNETPNRIAEMNVVVSHELLEKSHLCSVTAILRNLAWIESCAREFSAQNYFGFAACARGFVESVGDSIDGLLLVPFTLAEHHSGIVSLLSGRFESAMADFSKLEEKLDHYMFAGWSRTKGPLKAKDNQDYIAGLESAHIPDIIKHYRKLCAITHPSSSSVSAFYEIDQNNFTVLFTNGLQSKRCVDLVNEIGASLTGILPYSMNPSLLILRVLHKFGRHPKIPEMKKISWAEIPGWASISKALAV
jgi:hypothetical protein